MVRATLKYKRQREEIPKKAKLEIFQTMGQTDKIKVYAYQTTGQTDKIEVYAYENGPREYFLTLLQDFKDADTQFNMRNAISIDEYHRKFREYMKGSTRDIWDKIANTLAQRSTITFDENIIELVNKILGEDTEENQKDYIQNTEKPVKIPAGKWVQRFKKINNRIKLMGDGAESLMEKITYDQMHCTKHTH